MSLPRPVLRLATVATAALAMVGLGAGIASAHVTVSSPNAGAGGFGTVVFTVPNESGTANTTRVQVQIPDSTPLAQVPVAGSSGPDGIGWVAAMVTPRIRSTVVVLAKLVNATVRRFIARARTCRAGGTMSTWRNGLQPR